jgi:hypothetical protein
MRWIGCIKKSFKVCPLHTSWCSQALRKEFVRTRARTLPSPVLAFSKLFTYTLNILKKGAAFRKTSTTAAVASSPLALGVAAAASRSARKRLLKPTSCSMLLKMHAKSGGEHSGKLGGSPDASDSSHSAFRSMHQPRRGSRNTSVSTCSACTQNQRAAQRTHIKQLRKMLVVAHRHLRDEGALSANQLSNGLATIACFVHWR